MIAVLYLVADFQGGVIFATTLRAAVDAARLPTLLAVSTEGGFASLWLETDLPLSPGPKTLLYGVVSAADGAADELAAVKLELEAVVNDHARILRQSADKTTADVDAVRDVRQAEILAAITADEATAIAVAYIGRPLA